MSTTPKFTAPPWLQGGNDEFIVIGSAEGAPICAIPLTATAFTREELEANANIIVLAPELFLVLASVVEVMRRADVERCKRDGLEQVTDEEWDAALDEAEALLELVREGWR